MSHLPAYYTSESTAPQAQDLDQGLGQGATEAE